MKIRLRNQVALYLAPLVVLSVIAAHSVIGFYIRKEMQRNLKNQLDLSVDFVSRLSKNLVKTTQLDLEILAANQVIFDFINFERYSLKEEALSKKQEIYKFIDKLFSERRSYVEFGLTSRYLKNSVIRRNMYTLAHVQMSELLPKLKYFKKSKNLEISEPFRLTGVTSELISIKYTLKRKNRDYGSLWMVVCLNSLIREISEINFFPESKLMILRDDSSKVIHFPCSNGFKPTDELISSDIVHMDLLGWNLKLVLNKNYATLTSKPIITTLVYILVIHAFVVLSVILFFSKKISSPAEKLVELLKLSKQNELEVNDLFSKSLHGSSIEFSAIATAIDDLLSQIRKSYVEKLNLIQYASKSEIAHQVAHDIRSPLAALKTAIKYLSGISEDDRLLIRTATERIQDISNTLLNFKSRENGLVSKRVTSESSQALAHPALISNLLEAAAAEKRVQYLDQRKLKIELFFDDGYFELFSKVNDIELKRVISNILNNAIEATQEDFCHIKVKLTKQKPWIVIEIIDNGKGIPGNILPHLGDSQLSVGKDEGSGLGLKHAKASLAAWGGQLLIQSEINKGTRVQIRLPEVEPPNWFIRSIQIDSIKEIVILDDDLSIHQVWERRFGEFLTTNPNLTLHHLFHCEELAELCKKVEFQSNTLFLIDYELIGQKYSGLDMIRMLNLGMRAILVTSHYEKQEILKLCQEMGTRIIPKGLAAVIPIRSQKPAEAVFTPGPRPQIWQ